MVFSAVSVQMMTLGSVLGGWSEDEGPLELSVAAERVAEAVMVVRSEAVEDELSASSDEGDEEGEEG
jgi:hypothetical protein